MKEKKCNSKYATTIIIKYLPRSFYPSPSILSYVGKNFDLSLDGKIFVSSALGTKVLTRRRAAGFHELDDPGKCNCNVIHKDMYIMRNIHCFSANDRLDLGDLGVGRSDRSASADALLINRCINCLVISFVYSCVARVLL